MEATMFTINENSRFNSLEVVFQEKPSELVRNVLKSFSFRWNPKRSLWYGFANKETLLKALETETPASKEELLEMQKTGKACHKTEFDFDIKVGDIFYASWGYEQTNVDFFQVTELLGKKSVRIIPVDLEIESEEPISGMSVNRKYKIPDHILKSSQLGILVHDVENGDVKRVKSFAKNGKDDPIIIVKGIHCHKYNGEPVYESWYY